jgi:hypothetical protein
MLWEHKPNETIGYYSVANIAEDIEEQRRRLRD